MASAIGIVSTSIATSSEEIFCTVMSPTKFAAFTFTDVANVSPTKSVGSATAGVIVSSTGMIGSTSPLSAGVQPVIVTSSMAMLPQLRKPAVSL